MKTVPFLAVLSVLMSLLLMQILATFIAPLLFPFGVPKAVPNGYIPLGLSLLNLCAIMIGLLVFEKITHRFHIGGHLGARRSLLTQVSIAAVLTALFLGVIGVMTVNLIVELNA